MKNKKNLKLGIVGYGFVGKATDYGFSRDVEKYIVDPLIGTNIQGLKSFGPEIVFVSVPTPMSKDGSQDSTIIKKAIKELTFSCPDSIKVVKSTVLPSILQELAILDNKIIYNPEFLREKHANEDFKNSNMIILGGDRNISEKVSKAYKKHSCCDNPEYIFTDLVTASFIKYSINTFLASKVMYFNELHQVFEKIDVNDNWESVIDIISKDQRIGGSHMNVPGHDGKRGFGGACFPKDSAAFLKFAENNGINLNVLKTVIKTNNEIRASYDYLDDREIEQNVFFEDK